MAVIDRWRYRDGKPKPDDGKGYRWQVRWRGHRTRSFRAKSEALTYEIWCKTNLPERGRRATATVGDLTGVWLSTKAGLSAKGVEACRYAASHVTERWGSTRLVDLVGHEIQAWVAAWDTSQSSKAKALQCLAGVCRIGIERGIIAANPCDTVRVGQSVKREARFLTVAELNRLADCAGVYRVMVLMLGTTGLRISEACDMLVGDVDVARARARVRKSKTGKARDVPIPRFVLELLDLGREPSSPLFTAPLGGRVWVHTWRAREFYPAARKAGLAGVRVHDLRHTAASLAIAAGANVKAVQTMLGHASATMTLDLYGHLMDDALDKVADRLGGMFADSSRDSR